MSKGFIQGRYIKPNHGSYLPKYILVFSVQTDARPGKIPGRSRDHSFRCVHCISTRIIRGEPTAIRHSTFTKPQEFWQLVYSLSGFRHTLWCVSHNALRSLALLGISSEFLQSRITTDKPRSRRVKDVQSPDSASRSGLVCLDSPPTIVGIRIGQTQGRCVFIDTLNYFKLPIDELARTIGKLPDRSIQPPSHIFDYQRDARFNAEVVFETFTELMQWVKSHDLGLFRYTAASQSYNGFRHRFMDHKICVHDNVHVKDLERTACFGGRTEVFKAGKCVEQVWQLDVNGLFPYVMRNNLFPRRMLDYDLTGIEGLARLPKSARAMLSLISITTRRPFYPAKVDGRIAYPVGTFHSTLCGPELDYASRSNAVKRVDSWAEYELAPLFTRWVDELWSLRRTFQASGNRLYDGFCKMLLNSLWGKFQQRGPTWIDSDDPVSIPPMSQLVVPTGTPGQNQKYRTVGWQLQKEIQPHELPSTFVAIGAFVTSYARHYMDRIRQIAGRSNVYYQGIDSIIVNRLGRDNLATADLLSESELGKLKIEMVADSAEIFGVYDYRIGDKVITAGRAAEPSWANFAAQLQSRYRYQASIFAGDCRDVLTETANPWTRMEKVIVGRVKSNGWVEPIHVTGDSADGSTASDDSVAIASPIT